MSNLLFSIVSRIIDVKRRNLIFPAVTIFLSISGYNELLSVKTPYKDNFGKETDGINNYGDVVNEEKDVVEIEKINRIHHFYS